MSLGLPTDLQCGVDRYAEAERITPDEAVTRLVQKGLRSRRSREPVRTDDPERTIGAFADMPEFVEIMEVVISRRAAKHGLDR